MNYCRKKKINLRRREREGGRGRRKETGVYAEKDVFAVNRRRVTRKRSCIQRKKDLKKN